MIKISDLPPGIQEWALYLRNMAMNVYTDHAYTPYFYILVGFTAAMMFVWWWCLACTLTEPKGKVHRMGTRQRRKETDAIVADMITEGLEEMEFNGKLHRTEVDRYYKMFTRNSMLPGLQYQIRKRSNHDVRMDIIGRRGDGPYHSPETIPFPDASATTEKATPKKSYLASLLFRK